MQSNIFENEVLTLEEIAEYLRVNRMTVTKEIDNENLKAFKVGRQWRIYTKDFKEYLEKLKNGK